MPLDSYHPSYNLFISDWAKLRACYGGEEMVKAEGQIYLPATAGQMATWREQGPIAGIGLGEARYNAYKARATFPDFVAEAVRAMIGVMHAHPPVIELPPVMEPLLERATLHGEGLPLLLRRINEAQFITGRIGLMLDLPEGERLGNILPYIATYDAEKIRNWDDGKREMPTIQTLNLVVLDESEYERDAEFQWELIEKYRVLILGDAVENEAVGFYRQGLFRDTVDFNESALMEPAMRGMRLDQIPFVFINSKDLLAEPDYPPLLQLADLCLSIYRNSADYEQSLYLQAQDTLVVVTNLDTNEQAGKQQMPRTYPTGAGATIEVPIGGDAKYIGVNSQGLSEQRQAIENKSRRALELAAQLLDTTSRSKESGEALRVRVAAQTARLNQIALAGAEGLQTILRIAAKWIGADPEMVTVTPNLDFTDRGITARELFDLMAAKEKGLPLSEESIHALLKEHEWTVKEFEEEDAALQMERDAAQAKTDASMEAFGRGVIQ